MALYEITVKRSAVVNGVRLEKGMSVEVVSTSSNPVGFEGGVAVYKAFMQKYNVDLKKASSLNVGMLETRQIN